MYKIVVVAFSINDQTKKGKFFQKTFLVANVRPDIIAEMLFLTLSDANIDFPKKRVLVEILYYWERFFYYQAS